MEVALVLTGSGIRSEPTGLNREAVVLALKIQKNSEELGI